MQKAQAEKAYTLGTKNNPYTHAPDGFSEDGLPYGAWCKCQKCGLVARSTILFDYYISETCDALECETCFAEGAWGVFTPSEKLDAWKAHTMFSELPEIVENSEVD